MLHSWGCGASDCRPNSRQALEVPHRVLPAKGCRRSWQCRLHHRVRCSTSCGTAACGCSTPSQQAALCSGTVQTAVCCPVHHLAEQHVQVHLTARRAVRSNAVSRQRQAAANATRPSALPQSL